MVSESTTIPNHHNKLHKTKPRSKSPSPRQNTSISAAFRPIPWVLNSSALPTQKTKRVSFVDKASRWRWWSDGSDRVEPPPPGWRHTPKGSRGSNSTTLSLPSLHTPPNETCYQTPKIIDPSQHYHTDLNTPHDPGDSENVPYCIPHDLLPSHGAAGSAALNKDTRRRWTLSIDIADEEVSDEMFVQELERIRTADGTPFALSLSGVSAPDVDHYFSDDGLEDASVSHCSSTSTSQAWPWTSARLVLLIVRELVRTERHYISNLRRLSKPHQNGRLFAPPMMSAYAQAICRVSEDLLSGFESDMTVAGVCTTFSLVFEAENRNKEHAYIGWCGVVGEWFTDETPPPNSPRKLRRNSLSVSCGSPRIPLPTFHSLPESTMFATVRRRLSSASMTPTERRISPAVRDLAILPTQRVARYVLLYRDLLAHTPPSSPTYSLVAHAVDVAVSLAQKCDKAQSNTAFLIC